MSQVYKLGELFSGAGGMALGASMVDYADVKFEHRWACDSDGDACKTFRHNIRQNNVYNCDVRELDVDKLSDIDGLLMGFPCNDFSIAGKRKGIGGQFGGLYEQGVRILNAKKPSFFLAENVGGMSLNDDEYHMILDGFGGAGYDLYVNKYKFEEHGVPQRRHRLIIAGFRNDYQVTIHEVPKVHGNTPITAGEALLGMSRALDNHEFPCHAQKTIDRLSHIKPGENAFTADLPAHLRLGTRGVKMSMIYRRLHPDKPSYTITAAGGGGTYGYHHEEPRALTNRECARLQSFPDDFVFFGNRASVRKQIGMAVPPLGAMAALQDVANTLGDFGIYPLDRNKDHSYE